MVVGYKAHHMYIGRETAQVQLRRVTAAPGGHDHLQRHIRQSLRCRPQQKGISQANSTLSNVHPGLIPAQVIEPTDQSRGA